MSVMLNRYCKDPQHFVGAAVVTGRSFGCDGFFEFITTISQ
jgi:hypothetical protein